MKFLRGHFASRLGHTVLIAWGVVLIARVILVLPWASADAGKARIIRLAKELEIPALARPELRHSPMNRILHVEFSNMPVPLILLFSEAEDVDQIGSRGEGLFNYAINDIDVIVPNERWSEVVTPADTLTEAMAKVVFFSLFTGVKTAAVEGHEFVRLLENILRSDASAYTLSVLKTLTLAKLAVEKQRRLNTIAILYGVTDGVLTLLTVSVLVVVTRAMRRRVSAGAST